MNFTSDNEAPAHPAMIEAISRANEGFATAYSNDSYSKQLDQRFSELFDTDCRVLPIATGTAANCVAIAELSPPWGAVLCHELAHIHNDENGAPEFFSGGAKLLPLAGDNGKLDADTVAATIDSAGAHGVHNVKPSVVSITQASECGTSYRPEEIRAIADVTHERGLHLHMDGARFANAVHHLGCHPAETTWKAGVDVLSFGATKNGALTAEAIVVFGHPEWLEGMERRRKRAGHLFSKMRYVSAQLLAMLDEDLWLELGGIANARAAELARGIETIPGASLYWPVESNEVFMKAAPEKLAALKEKGFQFHIWPGHDDLARLVCSWATSKEDVSSFLEALDS
ncbi:MULTISPECIES: low specificity L-threonine aldolase [unclassified Wenzhouxiangella]|uniref:threonine aldolase family protein n=1 Tax=unclassified Wenzhouxiangella TaxID=2613841 RepID=UPI000E328D40|nr:MULTISPECIES: low specificity L-threonine aldolase [unclassified Wenzhouxiangella]RFF28169.1 low specificity L-threonine aldolase [Wenzhouxiangella sp. 15181]RFP67964.1 low specificity L-threonine aldolase [Wenzhouxiangella sp. 15190]